MSSRIEQLRRGIIESGSPLVRHSLSGHKIKNAREGERRLEGLSGGGGKVRRARKRHEQFLANLQRSQVERGLRNMLNGGGTPEETNYVLRHIANLKRTINGVGGLEVTIIDLTPPHKVTSNG